jgi:mono/diheme cytochrome c family protein
MRFQSHPSRTCALAVLLTSVVAALLAGITATFPSARAEPPPAGPEADKRDVPDKADKADKADFAREVRPIFEAHCYKCHDAGKHKGGLRLDSKQTAFIGGDSGEPSLVPHDPDHSKLIQLVRGDDPDSVMPPKGKRLTPQQVDVLVRWVKQGADWPEGIDKPSEALTHWSFNKPVRPALPDVKQKDWVRNPIDAFVLAGLEKAGLSPSPEADRYELVRRASLDLVGLPPTPEEVEAFVEPGLRRKGVASCFCG